MRPNVSLPPDQIIVAGLNPQQVEAATAPFDAHCLVLAGAGTGKTSVLTRRIALCASTFCEQERILALTFTRKAAEEMQVRVRALPGIRGNTAPPKVTTFHGFGLFVLRDTVEGLRNVARLGYGAEPRLMSKEERLEALAALSTLQERRALETDLFGVDDLLACEAVNPCAHLDPQRRALLKSLALRFSRLKLERNMWEFPDMLSRTLELLEGFPEVARHYGETYRHVVVDEFQDTNPLQIRLLKKLLCGGAKVFAVGDDDQAIYGFRGADTGPILDFAGHFEDPRVLKLETNYRSRPAILRAANRLFAEKPAMYRKVLRSGKYAPSPKEAGRKPLRRTFDDQQGMVRWVVATMRKVSRSDGIPVERMCLLFRLNETLDWARDELGRTVPPGEPAPMMMTVHGSKGLEFPVVFLCDLEESVFPHYRRRRSEKIRTWGDLLKRMVSRPTRRNEGGDLEEEKRLFYVGVTRARERLFLLSSRKKKLLGRTVSLEPSRFLRLV